MRAGGAALGVGLLGRDAGWVVVGLGTAAQCRPAVPHPCCRVRVSTPRTTCSRVATRDPLPGLYRKGVQRHAARRRGQHDGGIRIRHDEEHVGLVRHAGADGEREGIHGVERLA